jgi:succinoglycan biosynthesis transport protein ExoP
MKEPGYTLSYDRPTWAANFFARLTRYRTLVRRRWWVPVLGVCIAMAIQGGRVWFTPPVFTSVGRMIVSIKLNLQEGSIYTEEMSNYLGTQAALMQCQEVTRGAHARVAAQNLTTQPVSLQVTLLPRTTIFVLKATGSDPQYAQAFLKACMEEYIAFKKEMRSTTSDTTLAGLTEETGRLESRLQRDEEELVAFQMTNSVVILEEQGNSAGRRLATLNARLADLKSEYDLLKAMSLEQNLERQKDKAESPSGATDPAARSASGGGGGSAPEYFAAKQQITLLKAEQADLGQFLKPKHPKMVALDEQIAAKERLLDMYREQGKEKLESIQNSLELQMRNLEKEIKEWEEKTLVTSQLMARYQKLRANQARSQALYERLRQATQSLDVNKVIASEGVNIMESASPAMPERPDLRRSLLLGALVGLVLSVGLLLLLDRLDDRMNSYTELEQYFDETVMGQIPKEKAPTRHADVVLVHPDDNRHSFVEAYRNLRSSLLYLSGSEKRPKTILLTSSVPNDGKSLTAANLAVTLASAGSSVLLVDADLRKGVLHNRFDLSGESGLAEVLSQGVRWRDALQATSVPNLSLLARGASTHRSAELFLGKVMGAFLEEAAANYEYLIVDSAPVMAADDVTSLAPRMDGVIFVIRAEYTSARVARAALELLYQRQTRVLGIVFNGVRTGSGDYYYYYKYKDYYRKYPSAGAKKS